jgi:hypothetical protein
LGIEESLDGGEICETANHLGVELLSVEIVSSNLAVDGGLGLSSHGVLQFFGGIDRSLGESVKSIILGAPGGGVILDSLSEGGKINSIQGSGEGTLSIGEVRFGGIPFALLGDSSLCEGSTIGS